ncbi:MAG TPA: hypothetical protein VFI73_14160 [Candidatus Nitrosopolaris sp.]|nr:hypothetical protein [Candidatus Nitrosopolaris sp.]
MRERFLLQEKYKINEMNRTPSQMNLNWLRKQHCRGVFVPIVGASPEARIKK